MGLFQQDFYRRLEVIKKPLNQSQKDALESTIAEYFGGNR